MALVASTRLCRCFSCCRRFALCTSFMESNLGNTKDTHDTLAPQTYAGRSLQHHSALAPLLVLQKSTWSGIFSSVPLSSQEKEQKQKEQRQQFTDFTVCGGLTKISVLLSPHLLTTLFQSPRGATQNVFHKVTDWHLTGSEAPTEVIQGGSRAATSPSAALARRASSCRRGACHPDYTTLRNTKLGQSLRSRSALPVFKLVLYQINSNGSHLITGSFERG